VPAHAALVQRIFRLYVERRLGSAAISGLLNDAGAAHQPRVPVAIDRYLRAFETGRLSESTCADRLAELDREVRALLRRARGSYAYRSAEASGYAHEPWCRVAEHLGHHTDVGTRELNPLPVGARG
jgi:hypothetical protein